MKKIFDIFCLLLINSFSVFFIKIIVKSKGESITLRKSAIPQSLTSESKKLFTIEFKDRLTSPPLGC